LLAVVPVAVAGWVLGLHGGLLASLVILPLHTLLVNIAGISGWDVIIRETNGLGPLVSIAVGVAVGYWSDLVRALQQQIAKRKQAEEALRESKKLQGRTFASLRDAVFIIDAVTTKILDCNPATSEIFGYSYEDMIGQTTAFLHVSEAALEEFRAHLYPAVEEKGYMFLEEFQMKRKDGTLFPSEHSVFSLEDEDGQRIGWVSVVRDLTERKRTEQALHESEQRFSVLSAAAFEGIVISDKGQIIDVNEQLAAMLGYERSEMIGCTVEKFVASESLELVLQHIRSGSEEPYEHLALRKDGSTFPVEIRAKSFPYKGRIVRVTAIRDITERKLAEQVVRDNQARLAGIIDSAMDAIVSLDANQRIILFNPAAEQLFRCPADEAIGQPLDRFIPELFREAHREHIRNFGQTNQASRAIGGFGPLTCLRTDGEQFPAEISVSQIGIAEGKIFTAIVRDITEQAQAVEMLNRRVNELTALYQTTLDIINSHNLPDLLQTIVARAVDLLGGTSGGLYTCDPEKKEARCVVSYKTPADYTGTVLAYGEGAAGIVAATGEPLIIDDYLSWEGRVMTYEENHPFNAVISVPMLWHGQVNGVIHVLDDTQQRKFTGEDLKLLTPFANQASIAIENARLLEETQRRLDRLSILRQIDQVISSGMDLRLTMNILLGHILQQLKVDAATVLLYQPELRTLEFVAGQGFRTQALHFTNLRLGQGFAGRAALEQHLIHISDLNQMNTGFLRSPEFRNEGFLSYIGIPLIAKGNITGVLEIYHRQVLDPDREWMEYLHTLAGQAAIAIDNIRLFDNMQSTNMQLLQAYDATIQGWAKALELRNSETAGHSQRTVDLTLRLARRMGIEEGQLAHVRRGALLHDIGKMSIPDAILQKAGLLNEAEWEIVRQHPVHAHKWLAPITYLQPALDIPLCHHEKWDGTGYPHGLMGEQIPLAARIFSVVDVLDVLTNDQPYRPAWTKEKALEYIQEQSGCHFDPKVVKVFLKMIASAGTTSTLPGPLKD
jgi:PAS domain S-box-containing protein